MIPRHHLLLQGSERSAEYMPSCKANLPLFHTWAAEQHSPCSGSRSRRPPPHRIKRHSHGDPQAQSSCTPSSGREAAVSNHPGVKWHAGGIWLHTHRLLPDLWCSSSHLSIRLQRQWKWPSARGLSVVASLLLKPVRMCCEWFCMHPSKPGAQSSCIMLFAVHAFRRCQPACCVLAFRKLGQAKASCLCACRLTRGLLP